MVYRWRRRWIVDLPPARSGPLPASGQRLDLRDELGQAAGPKAETVTCSEWADRWREKRERDGGKASSLSTARRALKPWRATFGPRPIGSIDDVAA
jgi:hypothetical protein